VMDWLATDWRVLPADRLTDCLTGLLTDWLAD